MGRVVTRCRELLAEDGGWGRIGFYSSRTAVTGGLLHARRHREGRHRHAAHGREHSAVHGDGRIVAQGIVRHRWAARFVHRCGPLRRDRAVGPQCRRDANRVVGADARSARRRRAPASAGRRSPDHACRRVRPTCISPPRPGTNLALMNAIIRELIERGWVDHEYVAAHTLGFEQLQKTVSRCTFAACRDLRRRGSRAERAGGDRRHLGASAVDRPPRLLPVEPGDGSSCAVNNIHLLRGMIGRPGAGVLQMNGQPTAQNNRECGADGDLPGFRNWENPRPRRGARRAVERRPADHPALGAPDPRHGDLPVRGARLDRAAVDRGDEPGGVVARFGRIREHPRRRPAPSSSCRTSS